MLHDLLSGKQNEVFEYVVRRYISDPEGKNYAELVSEIYKYMGKEYRSEYFYKNTMLNKLLIKKHDYRNTIVLTELPVANSKADFIMINGRGVVYEIKTELDNLERLDSQITDYYKAFKEVVIVTYENNIDKVFDVVPESVGVMVLTKRRALKTIRESKETTEGLDMSVMFEILRKYEFEEIIKKQGWKLPEVSQFVYYKECYKLVSKLSKEELQQEMLAQLKKRMKIEVVEFAMEMPEELRFLSYFDDSIFKYGERVKKNLLCNYGG
jgi:hypothetical protein